MDYDTTKRRWNLALSKPKSFGPFQYLFQHAPHIGWYPSADLFIQCNGKQYSVLDYDIHKWYNRIARSWLGYVSNQRAHKKEWAFLGHVDWETTMKLRQQSKDTLHILASFSSGAAMFSDQKRHFLEDEATLCCHCKQHDTQRHRLFDCPFYEDCRRDLPVTEMRRWPGLITERGLFKKPVAVEAWDQLVGERPEPSFATFFHEPHVYYTKLQMLHHCRVAPGLLFWQRTMVKTQPWSRLDFSPANNRTSERSSLLHWWRFSMHLEEKSALTTNQWSWGSTVYLTMGGKKLHWNKRRHSDLWYRVWQFFLF